MCESVDWKKVLMLKCSVKSQIAETIEASQVMFNQVAPSIVMLMHITNIHPKYH